MNTGAWLQRTVTSTPVGVWATETLVSALPEAPNAVDARSPANNRALFMMVFSWLIALPLWVLIE